MEKLLNINLVIIIGIIFMIFFPINVNASSVDNFIEDVTSDVGTFQNAGANKASELGVTEEILDPIAILFNLIQTVAIVLLVPISIILGFIILFTLDSEKKGKLKKFIVIWLVACILVIAAEPIWQMIMSLGDLIT